MKPRPETQTIPYLLKPINPIGSPDPQIIIDDRKFAL